MRGPGLSARVKRLSNLALVSSERGKAKPTHQKLVEMISANLDYARLEAVSSSGRSRGFDGASEGRIEGTVDGKARKVISRSSS